MRSERPLQHIEQTGHGPDGLLWTWLQAYRALQPGCSFQVEGRGSYRRVTVEPADDGVRGSDIVHALQRLWHASTRPLEVEFAVARTPSITPSAAGPAGLVAVVQAAARAAEQRGRAFAIGPMSVADRRVVHQALAEVSGVWTQSEGDGIQRRLWVIPRGRRSTDAPVAETPDVG